MIKSEKLRILWASIAVFILLSLLYAAAADRSFQRDRKHAFAQAELNAKVYTVELERDFERGAAVTETLEEVIINGKGRIPSFQAIAGDLMRDYLGSIQIAPGGVVTDICPMEGNEGGLIDLLHDPTRGPIAAYGMEHDVIAMQGPFPLKQGGLGIAVRNPVFLTDADGNRSFWGFTIVIIKAPDIFRQSFESLESFGYDYIFSATISPLSEEYKVIASSRDALEKPVEKTFQAGGCTWRLELAPKNGWSVSRESVAASAIGAMFVLLLTVSFAFLLTMVAQRRHLRVMAETDPLTGLMNRKGRVALIDEFLKANLNGTATEVFLDIDDFKIINDLYGHDVGDEALKNLAANLVAVFGEVAVVSRTGGDEFGVFIPGYTAEQAEPLIRAAMERDQTFTTAGGRTYTYTISMGYSDYPAQARTRETLARNVDSALYNVKLNGKHGCQRYVPGTKQSRQQLGFTQKELLKNLPGASFICHAEDTSILYANDELIRLFACENREDLDRLSNGIFSNLLHPDDYERIMRERSSLFIGKTEGDHVSTHFRVVTKSGTVKNLIALARFQHHAIFGDLHFVTSMDLDETPFIEQGPREPGS